MPRHSGKWYCTEAIDMDGYYTGLVHECVARAIFKSCGTRLSSMTIVCLEPYHEHAHPIMMTPEQWSAYILDAQPGVRGAGASARRMSQSVMDFNAKA